MVKQFEVLDKKAVFQGYFRVDEYRLRFELHQGGWSEPVTREIFERGVAAATLLYDPKLDQVVLIEEFRPGVIASGESPWLLEIVAGIIESGEKPAEVARREALEEAGMAVSDLMPITQYWVSPGGTTETVYLFCGRVDASKAGGVFGLAEEGEDIKVSVVSSDEAFAKVRSGEIKDAPAIIALQWLELNKKTVFKG